MRRGVVLLDRDGTIIVERNYLNNPDGVELLPGAVTGLRRLAAAGFRLVVVTNQSGLGRGFFDGPTLDAIHDRLRTLLAEVDVTLDGVYVCPHTEDDDCDCRKPRPGLVLRAAQELGFDPAVAFVVGDKACDVDLGRAVGATSLLVRTGYGDRAGEDVRRRADQVVDDLAAAAAVIMRRAGSGPDGLDLSPTC